MARGRSARAQVWRVPHRRAAALGRAWLSRRRKEARCGPSHPDRWSSPIGCAASGCWRSSTTATAGCPSTVPSTPSTSGGETPSSPAKSSRRVGQSGAEDRGRTLLRGAPQRRAEGSTGVAEDPGGAVPVSVLGTFFPGICLLCLRRSRRDVDLCRECEAALRRNERSCPVCAEPGPAGNAGRGGLRRLHRRATRRGVRPWHRSPTPRRSPAWSKA